MGKLFTLHKETDTYIKIQKTTHELDVIVEISTEFDDTLPLFLILMILRELKLKKLRIYFQQT